MQTQSDVSQSGNGNAQTSDAKVRSNAQDQIKGVQEAEEKGDPLEGMTFLERVMFAIATGASTGLAGLPLDLLVMDKMLSSPSASHAEGENAHATSCSDGNTALEAKSAPSTRSSTLSTADKPDSFVATNLGTGDQ